jgi:hypothetical protein
MTDPVRWVPRSVPLPVAAATAAPTATGALLEAVAERVEAGAALRLVTGQAGCVVLGTADDLPWCSGVVYLGWEAGALTLTTRSPRPSVDLLLPSLRDRLPAGHDLLAVVPWGVLAAPSPTRAVDLATVQALR